MYVFLNLLQVAILVDDMIDTGKTLTLAAKTLREKGARSVHALISHGSLIPYSIRIEFIVLLQAFSQKRT